MKKILYINGNPQQENQSYSRRVGKYLLDQKRTATDDSIDIVNVYEDYVPLIDEDVLTGWGALRNGVAFDELSDNQQDKIGRMNAILNQFKEADEYVFVTPLWNFSLPPMLKAFIDNVMIAGETFTYTENGPVGLLGDKKATIIQASGGVYSSGPAAAMDHASNLLVQELGFMGVSDIKIIRVEGVAIPGKSDEERLEEAYRQVDERFDAVSA